MVVFGRRCICLFDLAACHLVEVLRMISEVMLQVLADRKSIMYGLRSERFGVEFYVKLNFLYLASCVMIDHSLSHARVSAADGIMPPRMTTRSAGRATTVPRGGRTGGRTGRGGGRTRGRSGDQGNGGIDGQGGQVGGQDTEVNDGNQGRNQENNRNQKGDAINDNIWGDVRNVIKNNDRMGYTYKEFLACNPKEYNGKGGATVYTRWIEKMESVQDMSECRDSQKVKYTAGSFVGKSLTW
ncbi:hypothetical protein Tco_0398221 [Tanacetum coccineum]